MLFNLVWAWYEIYLFIRSPQFLFLWFYIVRGVYLFQILISVKFIQHRFAFFFYFGILLWVLLRQCYFKVSTDWNYNTATGWRSCRKSWYYWCLRLWRSSRNLLSLWQATKIYGWIKGTSSSSCIWFASKEFIRWESQFWYFDVDVDFGYSWGLTRIGRPTWGYLGFIIFNHLYYWWLLMACWSSLRSTSCRWFIIGSCKCYLPISRGMSSHEWTSWTFPCANLSLIRSNSAAILFLIAPFRPIISPSLLGHFPRRVVTIQWGPHLLSTRIFLVLDIKSKQVLYPRRLLSH